jgi:hypothetical protein
LTEYNKDGEPTDNTIELVASEALKIADWLKSDLLLQASFVKISVEQVAGIGQAVTATALDFDRNVVAKLNATDYTAW